MYLVSILVPVYGVEKYIERCARSLFEQTYNNLEYIFVDDCSPDNSIAILKRVMEDYPERKEQVRIIRHERNRGLAAARNTALDAAQGSFLSHVDSDDYLARDAIRLLVNKQVETGADIVTGIFSIITHKGIQQSYRIDYNDKHSMLLKVFDIHAANRFVWGRLIKLSLYNDHHIRAKEGINNGEDWQQTPMLVYYTSSIAKIDNIVYYYNCNNEHSYTYDSRNHKKTELWDQAMQSINIMESFFVEQESEYKEAAHRLALAGWRNILHLSATFRKKSIFDKTKNIILTNYTDCFDEIRWDNPINRVFRCNYTLHSYYRRLHAYMMRFVVFVKR